MKKYQKFLSENFQFLVMNFSIYLNRRAFIMAVFSLPFGKGLGLRHIKGGTQYFSFAAFNLLLWEGYPFTDR